MNDTLLLLAGIGLGLALARVLMEPSSCCQRVAAGVRDKVGTELGSTAQAIGDALGLWQYTPGLLDATGVPL